MKLSHDDGILNKGTDVITCDMMTIPTDMMKLTFLNF